MRLIKLVLIGLFCWCQTAIASDIVNIKSFVRHNTTEELTEVLLEFEIKSNWHVFAPYEQEFGSPLKIEWILPANYQILEESFSQPKRFNQDDFSFDGYENKFFYKTTIKTGNDKNNLVVKISWQACDEECIPDNQTLEIAQVDSPNFEMKLKQATEYFLSKDFKPHFNIVLILLMAFGGGVILNLMPCIFPVLSFKIIALAQMSEQERATEAIFYTLGVVVSMSIIAGLLFVIRLFDTSIGWGFQLQSPWFVGFMLILFIGLSLLMADIINFNTGWLSKLAFLRFSNNKINAFMTGLLAVLIASPCTAPFMGAAIGYALMAPAYIYFPIFTALGVGYAMPFALLALCPQIIRPVLPKPGKWMELLKKILTIPLILTVIWLAWLWLNQIGVIQSGKSLIWHDYSRTKVQEAVLKKQPVFIDFTAKWCLTCLVNKKAALQSDKMAELVKENNILLLRADATNQNAEVGAGLKYYGRASVPLYVYYDGKSDDYLILPQILTTGILEEYLQ